MTERNQLAAVLALSREEYTGTAPIETPAPSIMRASPPPPKVQTRFDPFRSPACGQRAGCACATTAARRFSTKRSRLDRALGHAGPPSPAGCVGCKSPPRHAQRGPSRWSCGEHARLRDRRIWFAAACESHALSHGGSRLGRSTKRGMVIRRMGAGRCVGDRRCSASGRCTCHIELPALRLPEVCAQAVWSGGDAVVREATLRHPTRAAIDWDVAAHP